MGDATPSFDSRTSRGEDQHSPPLPVQDSELSDTSCSRAASRPPSLVQQPQPIKDAVNYAFDQAPTTDQLDPDFIRRLTEQVTEQVIKNLQAANIGGTVPPPPFYPQLSPPLPTHPANGLSAEISSLQSSPRSFSPIYTPPSPLKNCYDRNGSPELAPSEVDSNASEDSRNIGRSQASTQSYRAGTSHNVDAEGLNGMQRRKPSAANGSIPTASVPLPSRRQSSHVGNDLLKDSKNDRNPYINDTSHDRARQDSASEDSDEATTLEKIWQPLFDNNNPTMRLSQFLRGVARHIIDDYDPQDYIVITPQKMCRFFNETRVAKEHYPWQTIFGGKMCYNSISAMYRKLLCQHYFVQQRVHEAPIIPALTPLGFEAFMTRLIQAHPDTEFERLAKVVKEMPISNADDRRERFPKELSRRLLPRQSNVQAEQKMISSLNHEPVLVRLERGAIAMPPPPSSAPPQRSTFRERERNPYSQASQSSCAVGDDDLTPLYMPIERERMPYSAKEGGGKRYDNENDRERESNSVHTARESSRPGANNYRSERPDPGGRRPSQRNPGVSLQTSYTKSGMSDPVDIPPPNRGRRATGPAPPTSSTGYGRGSQFSPPSPGFARSEARTSSSVPQSTYIPSGQGRERYANEVDDDPKGRPIPPGKPQFGSAGYDQGYGSTCARNGTGPGSVEERRRSWYPASNNPGPGGTDGYGSGAPTYGPSGQY